MAEKRQEAPDVELVIERDDNGKITGLQYYINDAGEDRKNIIEFMTMLNTLCDSDEVDTDGR